MEWGNFWTSHLPRTPYDIELDEDSPNRTDQVDGTLKIIHHLFIS
jgi:hexokinase